MNEIPPITDRHRKYSLACAFTLIATVGLFVDKLGGGEFVALSVAVLGLYGAANVMEKRK